MPRQLIKAPGADRNMSLGFLATWWIETFVVQGPGDVEGDPIVHGDEFTGFIVDCYILDSAGRRMHDSAFFSRPKGCNKSGVAAELVLFEALGPCRFDGWAKGGETFEFLGHTYTYEKGEPMGKPVKYPYVRIMATEDGQPLALDTPIPTPTGWSTMGQLGVGDYVIDSQGKPARVMRETEVFEGLDIYRVKFDDGEAIVASGSHLWDVQARVADHKYEAKTISTEYMARTYLSKNGRNEKIYKIPLTPAWELPEADLDVDPYFLGLWLGDGKAADSSVVFLQDDADEMKPIFEAMCTENETVTYRDSTTSNTTQARYRMPDRTFDKVSLRRRLRDLGVLNNKHIPAQYLRGSVQQRMELLKGLMDSDGGIDLAKGQASFTNTNMRIIDGFKELLVSLSFKYTERFTKSTLNHNIAARISFKPFADNPVTKLSRKTERHWERTDQARSTVRRIVDVERIESVPVKCIGINTPDHLFAAGKHAVLTHNTGNTYDMVFNNLEDGPLSALKAYGMRVNRAKVDLPFGGEIVPSTSGAASKDGGKETFVVFDETHLYNSKILHQMYDTVSRNLNKRKKIAGTWALETTTMYLPGEDSVAEKTYDYAQQIEEATKALAEGEKRKVRVKRAKLLFDHRWGDVVDFEDEEKLELAIEEAYGEALDWNSKQGIIDDLYDPRRTPEESRRYFLNALTEAHNSWTTPQHMARSTALGVELKVGRWTIKEGEKISLGFDGAVSNDATALIGCRISDGALFKIKIEEKPDGPDGENWIVDFTGFDAAVHWAFERFNVVAFFADPPHWQDYIDKWDREWGEDLPVKAGTQSAIKWWTKRDIPMSLALERLHQAISIAPGTPIDPDPVLVRHFINARRWDRRGGTVIGKDTKNSVKKIDGAMGATLAYEARALYLAKAPVEKPTFVPRRVR